MEADSRVKVWRKKSLELGHEFKKKKTGQEARSVLRQLPKTGVGLLSVTSAQVESLCSLSDGAVRKNN